MAQRAEVEIPDDFEPLEYVARAVKNSDCRTPIILVQEDGDPFASVCVLAKKTQSAVWSFDLELVRSANNIMDYVEVGVHNGDWVFITNCDTVDQTFFREVSRAIYLMVPDPDKCPRREYFRSLFCVKKPFDLNGIVDVPFPPLMIQNSVVARRKPEEKSKLVRVVPVDDPLYVKAVRKHQRRREQGRDSDSESDIDEYTQASGMLFYRSAELSKYTDRSPVTLAKDVFSKAIMTQDGDTIKRLVADGDVDISRTYKDDMTPLQYATCLQLTGTVKVLLELGANPNEPRVRDMRPPLFMCIEDIALAKALVAAGADMFAKFQGYRADSHPDTAPHVASFLLKKREEH